MTKKKAPVTQVQVVQPSKEDQARALLNDYITKEIVADFSAVPTEVKLKLLQKTPKKFIEERTVGGKAVHYVPHQYSKTCLNFVFNFRVSNEAVSEAYHSYTEEFQEKQKDGTWKSKTRPVTEAEVTMKFGFTWPDGTRDFRTVKSSHKHYENKATTRADAMQAAFSKSWTKVAATFGIGADLEDDLYAKDKKVENQDAIEVEMVDEAEFQPPRKAFDPGF